MANIHTWRILELLCRPRLHEKDNVIFKVVWECQAHNPDNPDIVAQHVDSTEIPYSPDSFTPYEGLTEEQVIAWVREQLGSVFEAVERAMDERLRIASLPPVVSPPLPWAQN